ncbi:hypothetical protein BsWGS_27881 [Bradybaena similaris]
MYGRGRDISHTTTVWERKGYLTHNNCVGEEGISHTLQLCGRAQEYLILQLCGRGQEYLTLQLCRRGQEYLTNCKSVGEVKNIELASGDLGSHMLSCVCDDVVLSCVCDDVVLSCVCDDVVLSCVCDDVVLSCVCDDVVLSCVCNDVGNNS